MSGPLIDPMLQKVALTALVVLVGVVHAIVGWRLERSWFYSVVLVVAGLTATIWVPQSVRDWVLVLLCGLLALAFGEGVFSRLFAAGLFGAIAYGIGAWIPGGTFTPILAVVVIGCVVAALSARKNRQRMAGAKALQPGQQSGGEVQFGGRARSLRPLTLPTDEEQAVAAWKVLTPEKCSEVMIEVSGDEFGAVLVDPTSAELDINNDANHKISSGDEARELLEAIGESWSPTEEEDERDPAQIDPVTDPVVNLSWIAQDAEFCVIGRPTWQPHASVGSDRGYRDAPVVPVFGEDAVLWDRSEQQLAVELGWRLWGTALWCPVCAIIAVYLIAGPF